jgi:hypothetical protein
MAIENLTLLDSTNATVNMPVDSFGGQLYPLQQQVFGADGGDKTMVSALDRFPVTLSSSIVIGQAGQTAVVNNILEPTAGANATNVLPQSSFSIQVVSTGTAGTYIFEGSNDNVNFIAVPVFNLSTIIPVPINTAITATASSTIYVGACKFRYLRLRIVTAITGGSIQAFSNYSEHALTLTQQPIGNGTAANLLATVSGSLTAVTTSGTPTAPATPYILNSLATTNGALILTGTSGLHAFYASNIGATTAYVKLYNKATAPTVGTDVPAMVIPVPSNATNGLGTATLPIGTNGFRFALGLGIAITGGVADSDTTAVTAGQVKVMLSRTV